MLGYVNLELLNQAVAAVLNASRTVAVSSSYCAILHSLSVARFFCFTLVPAGIYRPKFLKRRCTVTVKNTHVQTYEMEIILPCGREPKMQSQDKLSV